MDAKYFEENLEKEREAFELQKYGRQMNQRLAAHPVLEGRSAPLPESYSEPSPPNSNVSV